MTPDFLPRSAGSRLSMGGIACFFGFLWGYAVYSLFMEPLQQFGFWGAVMFELTRELLLVATVVLALLVAWCVATPKWVERLFNMALKKLYLAIAAGTFAILAFAFWRAIWSIDAQ